MSPLITLPFSYYGKFNLFAGIEGKAFPPLWGGAAPFTEAHHLPKVPILLTNWLNLLTLVLCVKKNESFGQRGFGLKAAQVLQQMFKTDNVIKRTKI